MKKSTMRRAYMGMVGDMKNLEQHFSRMAEQGWMIDKIGLVTHRYRAIEPCKKRFFVDFLPQITAFDYPENENAQDYRAMCEESGWTFVAANKQFHVFCADSENPAPIPIHTDNTIQAKIYLKACRKYELPWYIYAIFMIWFFSPLDKGVELFLSNISLFMAIGYCFFAVGYLWTFAFMIRWYFQTRKSSKNDLPMPSVNYRLARLRINVFTVGFVLFLVCVVIGVALEIIGGMPTAFFNVILIPLSAFGVGLWIRRQIDTKRRTRAGNIGFSIVVLIIMEIVLIGVTNFAIMNTPSTFNSGSLGNRPVLTLSDVGVTTQPDSSNTLIGGTPAVPIYYEHWAINRQGTVSTEVLRSISTSLTSALYDHFSRDFTIAHSYSPGMADKITYLDKNEAAFWGAEEGMAFFFEDIKRVDLLLLNEKKILQLSAESADMNLDTVRQAMLSLWDD